MTTSARVPPLLEAYLDLPPRDSLVLLTGVLGASTNWLVLRWLHRLLGGGGSGIVGEEDGEGMTTTIVLCSFLRDGVFWREGGSKMGLRLHDDARFVFVDGLTGLCAPEVATATAKGDRVLRGTGVEGLRRALEGAVAEASMGGRGRVVLVLDQMDVWLAMGDAGVVEVMALLLGLREKVHAAVVTVSADDPLLHAQGTTLEREHAAFAVSLAHEARRVMALRLLDTGTASDVSGVVRITAGGKGDGAGEGEGETPDAEFLYYVSGDGGVRVFERGA